MKVEKFRSPNGALPMFGAALVLVASMLAAACGEDSVDDTGGTGGTGGSAGGDGGAGGEGGAGPEPCAETTELTNSEFVGGTTLEAGSCYVVNQNLTLDDGTVTIEEGVSLEFATGLSVHVRSGGTLRIAGTSAAPVRFVPQDPLVTWKGIRLQDSQGSANVWEHLEIEGAGSVNWSGANYSGAAVYLDGSTTLTMDNVSIRGSKSHGLVAFEDVALTFRDGTFADNETPAFLHPNVVKGLGGETVFSDNANEHVRVAFGNTNTQTGEATWAALEVPYRFENRVYVQGDLTLEEGAVLEFAQNTELVLGSSGTLTAEGTEDAPIVFRGAAATRGYWKGIAIQAGGGGNPVQVGATFDFCEISDTGSTTFSGRADTVTAIYMGGISAAQITNTTFKNNESYGIWASADARLPGFANNTFTESGRAMLLHPERVGELSGTSTITGNDVDAVHVVLGNTNTVGSDATWKDLGVPYVILDRFYVEAALTIEAGTVLEGAQERGITVREGGSLTAVGVAGNEVVFRGQEAVETGFWQGLRFQTNSPANSLTHTIIEHAGSTTWTGAATSDAAIYVDNGAQVTLDNVTLGPGGGHGVFIGNASSSLSCTDVTFDSLVKGNVYDNPGGSVLAACP